MTKTTQITAKLPKLSPQVLTFALGYLEHGNATKAATDAGYSAKSAHKQGYRLSRNEKVKTYIRHFQEDIEQSGKVKREWIIDKLKEVVEVCGKPGKTYNPSAVLKALELLGNTIAMFKPKDDQDEERPAFVGITIHMGDKPHVELRSANPKESISSPLLSEQNNGKKP